MVLSKHFEIRKVLQNTQLELLCLHTHYCITKYGSTLYIGMDEVFQHHAYTVEKSNLNFHFQCEFSSVVAEW